MPNLLRIVGAGGRTEHDHLEFSYDTHFLLAIGIISAIEIGSQFGEGLKGEDE